MESTEGEERQAKPARRRRTRARLTPTQERLLGYIAEQTRESGAACSTKRELAGMLSCNVKTIDRAVSRLRREGYIVTEAAFEENGGQLANYYRVV